MNLTVTSATEVLLRTSNFAVPRPLLILTTLFLAFPLAANAQTKTYDFSNPSDAAIAAPYTIPGGVPAPVDISLQKGALQFKNMAGGSFGVQFKITPIDLSKVSDLSFDYTATPDTKVNIFFRVDSKYYALFFTGPKNVRPGTVVLSDLNVPAPKDGLVRGHIDIPLREWLARSSGTVEDMVIGNWDNEGYFLAGIGGNGPGATWTMDNLKLENNTETPAFAAAHWDSDELVLPASKLANFDWNGLVLHLGDRDWPLDGTNFRYVPARGFVFNAAFARQSYDDGQQLAYQLKRGDAVLASGNVTLSDSAQVTKKPLLPLVQFNGIDPQPQGEDFEIFPSNGWGGDSLKDSQIGQAYSGNSSLRLTNPRTASSFVVQRPVEIDVAQNPVLTFAYRADDRLRTDLNVSWDGRVYGIRFTDRDNNNPILGAIPDVKTDKQWHLAVIPLLDWMKKARPDATSWKIATPSFNDTAWQGNAKGVQWWLDDWKSAPKISGTLSAQVVPHDVTGVKAVSFALDQAPQTMIDETPDGGAKLEIPLGDKKGLWWLHVRARNGAGKWSDTAHYPVWIE